MAERPGLSLVSPSTVPDPPYPPEIRARGWKFELDSERIRRSDTWALADPLVRPWLLLLWMSAWDECPIGFPNDDRLIAAKIGMPFPFFQSHRDVLLRGWQRCSDGRLYHAVISARVLEMIDKRTIDRNRAAKWRDQKKQEDAVNVTRESRVSHALVTVESTVSTPPTTHHPKNFKSIVRQETPDGRGLLESKNGDNERKPPELSPGFVRFWQAYPTHAGRRKNRKDCAAIWRREKLEAIADEIVAHVEAMKRTPSWRPNAVGESFEVGSDVYLRQRRWEDGLPPPPKPRGPAL